MSVDEVLAWLNAHSNAIVAAAALVVVLGAAFTVLKLAWRSVVQPVLYAIAVILLLLLKGVAWLLTFPFRRHSSPW